MKKILSIIFATLLVAYIIVTVFFFTGNRSGKQLCESVEVVIADSLENHFLKEKEGIAHLKKADLYPVNKNSRELNTDDI